MSDEELGTQVLDEELETQVESDTWERQVIEEDQEARDLSGLGVKEC